MDTNQTFARPHCENIASNLTGPKSVRIAEVEFRSPASRLMSWGEDLWLRLWEESVKTHKGLTFSTYQSEEEKNEEKANTNAICKCSTTLSFVKKKKKKKETKGNIVFSSKSTMKVQQPICVRCVDLMTRTPPQRHRTMAYICFTSFYSSSKIPVLANSPTGMEALKLFSMVWVLTQKTK